MDLYKFLNNFNNSDVASDIKKMIYDIIIENEKEILEMNQEQLFENQDVKNRYIGFYSKSTQEIWESEGGLGSSITKNAGEGWNLFWSGRLFEKMNTDIYFNNNNNVIVDIYSDEERTNEILTTAEEYGKTKNPILFGLNKSNSKEFKRIIEQGLTIKLINKYFK
jgi:hypothetical protein